VRATPLAVATTQATRIPQTQTYADAAQQQQVPNWRPPQNVLGCRARTARPLRAASGEVRGKTRSVHLADALSVAIARWSIRPPPGPATPSRRLRLQVRCIMLSG